MKKIFLLFVLALLLAGCGAQTQNNQQSNADQNNGVFKSIRDAFDRSMALRCEYTDEDGEKSINYIKNKMIRTEGIDSDSKQYYGIFRDEKMYMWEENSNQGFVFDLRALADDNGTAMGETEITSIDDIIAVLETHKDQCSLENVPDSLFDVPNNIEFMDFSQLFNM